MLRKTLVTLAACFLFAGRSFAAPEAKGDVAWTPYQEPSESAFTTEVPKGWQIEAGTARRGTAKATPWLKATSTDGQTTIFNGSPSLPQFVIPGRLSGTEGKSFTGPGGTTVTFHYQTGKEFASTYGSHLLPAGCEKIELIRAQDEPELHERLCQKNPQLASNTSAGSALYSYYLGGQKEIAEIVVQTMINGNFWSVFDSYGFETKSTNESNARELAQHVHAKTKISPEWMASMAKAISAESAQGMAMLQQQNQQFNQWSINQTQQFNQRMAVQHQQGMDRIQAIGDRGRAQAQADAQWHSNAMVNHYAQMAVKDNNNYHQVLEIQNKHLEWSPTLHGNVEVPNY